MNMKINMIMKILKKYHSLNLNLMKILSRIEGDDSRLGIADDDPRIATLGIETSEQHTSLLTCLKAVVRKHIGASSETEKKIDQMCSTLEREHFVSYWA